MRLQIFVTRTIDNITKIFISCSINACDIKYKRCNDSEKFYLQVSALDSFISLLTDQIQK